MASNLIQENIAYYKGDDLFNVAWIGPTFNPRDPKYTDRMAALRRVFQGHNVVAELVGNWKDGLISEPFTWHLKDSTGQRAEGDRVTQAEGLLQRWIDWVEQQSLEIDPLATNFQQSDPWSEFVLSVGVTGEGSLRLWQPERFSNDPDPLHRIHLHAPKAGSVQVTRGMDGFVDKLTYSHAQGTETQQFNEDRKLVIADGTGAEPITLDTGGRWLCQSIRMPSLLTPSAKQKQGAICHSLTMMVRNQEIAGFRERTLLNAEFPQDEDGNPIEVERGPGIDQYLYGIPSGDEQNPSYTSPSIYESQPVQISTFEQSIQINRTLLYLEFRQGHLLSTGDGGLSGESRLQARAGFELHLRGWKRPIESAIANTLNIVLRILGYEDLEAVVELSITTGKLSAPERAEIRADYQAGLLSRASAIAKSGLADDPDAEIALIDEEKRTQTARRTPPDPMGLGDNGNGSSRQRQQQTEDPAPANGTRDPNPTPAAA